MSNEYGLDYRYFERKLDRMKDLSRYTPDEFARECLRMAVTADKTVLDETEFAGETKQQLREKEARIARLETGYDAAIPHIDEYAVIRQLSDTLNEAPQHSLSAIQADAVEKFAEHFWPKNAIYTALNAGEAAYQKRQAMEYAQQLRAEGK